MSQTEADTAALCHASFQTEPPVDLDDAAKQELLDSFAMELFLTSVLPRVEGALIQNGFFDVWHDDLGGLAEDDAAAESMLTGSRSTLVELQSFADMAYSQGRTVSAVQWVPGQKGAIAMTCITLQRKLEDTCGILIWSFATMMHPESILKSPVEVACFDFSCCRPGLVAGGCCTGQIIVWDYGKETIADKEGATGSVSQPQKHTHMCMSSIDHSHVGDVTDVRWLSSVAFSREGAYRTEDNEKGSSAQTLYLASTASDGRILFWDCTVAVTPGREGDPDSSWKPVYCMALKAMGNDTLNLLCNCLSFPEPEESFQLLAGSLLGDIIACSYAAVESAAGLQEGTKGGQNRPQQGHRCHYGCIVALQRSPFLPNVIMSAGGYDWALYTDDFLPAALMRSPSAPVQYTCAAWSTTRPGCLAVGREDGIVEVWDLLDRCHEPVMACTVSVAAVTSLCFSPAEEKSDSNGKIASHRQYLAAGSSVGLLHLLEAPRHLRNQPPNEQRIMENFVQRQALVARDMAKRMVDLAADATPKPPRTSPFEVEPFTLPPQTEEDQRIAEMEYAKMLDAYRAEWGLAPGERL